MTEQEAREAVKPHGSVRVLHPLRGSEDTKPELTREQKETIATWRQRYDNVEVDRILPNGSAVISCTDYDDDSQTSFTTRVHEITNCGIPF